MNDMAEAFGRAAEAGDVEGMLGALAPDAVLHSPVADGLRFTGREELARLFRATTGAYEDVRLVASAGEGRVHTLVLEARVGGREIAETLVLRLDEQGRVAELRPAIRPLAGLAAVAAEVGARLAADHGRGRATLARATAAPLVWMASSGERMGPRLIG